MNDTKKKPYVKPDIEVSQIEIENAICGGSADMTATSPGATTVAQTKNTDFGEKNNFGGGTEWDDVTTN